jgi:uncharacterized protein YabE (DUF348 family)
MLVLEQSTGYEVSYTTSPWRNQVAYPQKIVEDKTLLIGTKIVEDSGVAGHDVTVIRTVKKKGKVVRQDEFVSHYRTKEQVLRVGTKPKPKPKPASPCPPGRSSGSSKSYPSEPTCLAASTCPPIPCATTLPMVYWN